jgi:hypothetical protein
MLQLAQLFRRLPPETTPNKRPGHTERTRLYSGRKGRQAGSCEMMLVLPCHTQLLLPRLNLMRNAVRDAHTLVGNASNDDYT